MALGLGRKQAEIFNFASSPYDALICDGSIRSGKTTFMMIAFCHDAMARYNGQKFGICGQTVDSAIKNIIDPFLISGVAEKALECEVSWSRTKKILTLKKGKKVNFFEVFGGKDERSYYTIQGRTFAGILLDEVVLMPRSFVNVALQRCSVSGSKFWFSCNPGSQMHWFYTEWVQRCEERNTMHLHFTLDDNPSLSPEIKARYNRDFQGVFHDRYIKGLWVSADGLIYDMLDKNRHFLDDVPETEGGYYVAADFGIQNATVFLLFRKVKSEKKWVCLDEWYYSGRETKKQKTVSELADGFQSWIGDIKPKYCIVDPSAAALIEELRRRKYPVRGAKNEVRDGISDVSTMLGNDMLFFTKKCSHTLQEFGLYVWDEKASLRGEDIPVKENDHCMDALRYFVRTVGIVKYSKK